jgi:DNA topoisomerase-1
LRVLALPRLLGTDPEGQEIFAGPGRYGPYIRRGDDYRSLVDEDQIFTVTLGEALELLAAPKTRQRRAPAPPLKEMGNDPITEKPLVIKDGRFGPYVTDGETNASLRRGQSIEALTVEQASEMLAEKRAKGPAEPRKRTTRAVKSTAAAEGTAKKAAPKKAAKKATKAAAKKAAPKKAAPRKSAEQ